MLKEALALYVFFDLIFALLPLTFIYMIPRPLREKIMLACLMGLGLLASACSIVKVVQIPRLFVTQNPYYDGITTGIFAHLELHLGIIATCIPCLKAPFEDFLRSTGIWTKSDQSTQSSRSNDILQHDKRNDS